MNYQRCYTPIVSPYRSILRAKTLAIILLVFFSNASPYPLYAEQTGQSEKNSISELIDKYGKKTLINIILALRETRITIDVNGTLRDSQGGPQLAYVTPRSILHDIQQAGISVEQFSARIPGEVKREEARRLKARIKAEKTEAERKLAAINSKDEAFSWFEKQPLIVRIERSEGHDWAMIIYLKQSWYSLNMQRKYYIISKWVDVWKRVGGKFITFRSASNDELIATFHFNSVKVLK